MGRNTRYSTALATKICERIAGGEFLTNICQEEGFPGRSTVYRWLLDDKKTEFWDMYARAREMRCDHWLVECFEIADETSRDTIVKTGKGGKEYEVCNTEWVQRSRLRIDTRKWAMAKLWPRKYGAAADKEPEPEAEDLKPVEVETIPAGREIPRRPESD